MKAEDLRKSKRRRRIGRFFQTALQYAVLHPDFREPEDRVPGETYKKLARRMDAEDLMKDLKSDDLKDSVIRF